MSALNNQTNRNNTRYFFATSENGEQTLGLQYGTAGTPALSTMAVTISGASGNGVIVNQAPQFVASEFVLGDEAVCGGSSSTYFTPSTLTSNYTGFNLGTDRINGTGIACIESYGGNGSTGGFEFLSRGVASALLSTPMDFYLSTVGRPGATAALGASGTLAINNLIHQTESVPIANPANLAATATIFPASKTNVEFGAAGTHVVPIAGSSNQLFPWMPMFSTPISGLNPNTQNFISLNFANSCSSGTQLVNYKVGFSTATAYTNLVTTSSVPGGTWTPGGVPGLNTPQGYTLVSGCVDSDGINADGTATLYVLGQLANPLATTDQIFVNKGYVSETTRNALVWRPM